MQTYIRSDLALVNESKQRIINPRPDTLEHAQAELMPASTIRQLLDVEYRPPLGLSQT
jgi:hypothetical protein